MVRKQPAKPKTKKKEVYISNKPDPIVSYTESQPDAPIEIDQTAAEEQLGEAIDTYSALCDQRREAEAEPGGTAPPELAEAIQEQAEKIDELAEVVEGKPLEAEREEELDREAQIRANMKHFATMMAESNTRAIGIIPEEVEAFNALTQAIREENGMVVEETSEEIQPDPDAAEAQEIDPNPEYTEAQKRFALLNDEKIELKERQKQQKPVWAGMPSKELFALLQDKIPGIVGYSAATPKKTLLKVLDDVSYGQRLKKIDEDLTLLCEAYSELEILAPTEPSSEPEPEEAPPIVPEPAYYPIHEIDDSPPDRMIGSEEAPIIPAAEAIAAALDPVEDDGPTEDASIPPVKKPAPPAKPTKPAATWSNTNHRKEPSALDMSQEIHTGPCPLPVGGFLPEGYAIFINENGSRMRLARVIDGAYIPYGREGGYWYAGNWPIMLTWLEFTIETEEEPTREKMIWTDELKELWAQIEARHKQSSIPVSKPSKAKPAARSAKSDPEEEALAFANTINAARGNEYDPRIEVDGNMYSILLAAAANGEITLKLKGMALPYHPTPAERAAILKSLA